jgi:protein TonB
MLVACLLLPLVRPWRRQVIADTVTTTSRVVAVLPRGAAAPRSISPIEIAFGIILLGVAARFSWLAIGFAKLGRYRRRSRPFLDTVEGQGLTELRISSDITGPVTFGFRRPVILLPAQFPDLGPHARQAILCHELLHVERGDWLFTVAEEIVRSVFWFHPAIWWLLGEIQLAREQAVDLEVIERTQAREEYVDALLAIAGAKPQLDLAPAPLFLRRRHLKHRVVSILKEVRMSRTRLVSALAASMCVLVAACWLVTNTFPLAAAPQLVSDSAGVTVDVGAATLSHRAPVGYPESARGRRIQGTVVLELTLDGAGNVADARVLTGPEELRRPSLQSVLQWHFAHEAAGNKRQVAISFQVPAGTPAPPSATPAETRPARRPSVSPTTVRSINILGLSEASKGELLSKLPVRVGGTLGPEQESSLNQVVSAFDEHLALNVNASPDGAIITIVAPTPNASKPQQVTIALASNAIRVGGNEQAGKLIRQPRPMYPTEAKAARIQGVVRLMAIIGKDGTVQKLEVISGDPLLVGSALEAVRQWVYTPTLLNGEPVDVQTVIDVNYTLSQ